jgi:hypothetical protein
MKMKPDLKLTYSGSDSSEEISEELSEEISEEISDALSDDNDNIRDIVDNRRTADVNGNTKPMYDVVRKMRGEYIIIQVITNNVLESLLR